MNLILYWLLNAFGIGAVAKITIITFIVFIIVHIVTGILTVSEEPIIGGFSFFWAVVKIILLFVFIGTGSSLKAIILANSILAGVSLLGFLAGPSGAANLPGFIINIIGAVLFYTKIF